MVGRSFTEAGVVDGAGKGLSTDMGFPVVVKFKDVEDDIDLFDIKLVGDIA